MNRCFNLSFPSNTRIIELTIPNSNQNLKSLIILNFVIFIAFVGVFSCLVNRVAIAYQHKCLSNMLG